MSCILPHPIIEYLLGLPFHIVLGMDLDIFLFKGQLRHYYIFIYYLLVFDLLFIGLVSFFVNIINFGFLPCGRVWNGFGEVKAGERIGPRVKPH